MVTQNQIFISVLPDNLLNKYFPNPGHDYLLFDNLRNVIGSTIFNNSRINFLAETDSRKAKEEGYKKGSLTQMNGSRFRN